MTKEEIQYMKNDIALLFNQRLFKSSMYSFFIIYKDDVIRFIVDFEKNDFNTIVETVLYHCFTMVLKNNCKLQDLILTDKGEFIVIWEPTNYTMQ